MTNIAFIGLGIMGGPMAVHLQEAGHDVIGYNRHPDRIDAAGRGRRARRLVGRRRRADAEVVVTMVPDSPDVEDVAGRRGRRLRQRASRARFIDFSSIRPDVDRELAADGQGGGFRLLDAPVCGGEAGREERRTVDHGRRRRRRLRRRQARPRRGGQDHRARRARRCRPDRQGGQPAHRRRQHQAAGRGDRLPRGVRRRHRGRARSARRRAGRHARSWTGRGPTCWSARSSPGFRIDLHHKDMGIVTSAAREAGVVIPLGAIVAQLMASRAGQRRRRPGPLGPAARRGAAVRPARRKTDRQRTDHDIR